LNNYSSWWWDGLAPYFQKSCTLKKPSSVASKHLGLDYIDDEHIKLFNGPIQASFVEEFNDPLPRAWVETLGKLGWANSTGPFTGIAIGGYVNATKRRFHYEAAELCSKRLL
jgi:hypothetical protein